MSSQSSSGLIAAMQLAQTYLSRFGGPVLIVLGTVRCILNLIVFTQKPLRKNPCSMYFDVYLFLLFFLTLDLGYNIDPSVYNLVFCRVHLYAALFFHYTSQFYLILTSIDRILITSHNALTGRRSAHRLACICLTTGTIFGALFHSHTLIFANIIEIVPNYFACLFQSSIKTSFVTYDTIIKETLVLALMIILGLCSINSIRNVRRVRIFSA